MRKLLIVLAVTLASCSSLKKPVTVPVETVTQEVVSATVAEAVPLAEDALAEVIAPPVETQRSMVAGTFLKKVAVRAEKARRAQPSWREMGTPSLPPAAATEPVQPYRMSTPLVGIPNASAPPQVKVEWKQTIFLWFGSFLVSLFGLSFLVRYISKIK